ncbi:alpha/beta fold hydrolase [Pseudonocardia sp. KRD-184]|uniref:Alpha/beta fold hydrolase n=1 Tax=Pseudonocardia oceani TaxID=2792013 RepID=A0ABS6UBF4_9PSEU|nr:alpha/beta hydrolase [Pseudonocardia oceani]MBW0091327.1 alpha/beta fold hydrolase [Pseudonocardia oceani]MBW0097993.1 alpha/beta fold hydrolase [Pseudonocardia oceani]MBW0110554.1 alpha/beta fold hydrolase [Pseudonocardia oceani]MBW0124633.1 alpha/beta fold hydrolase [Pseudonocardia oceani]MBW0129575.1 alpha/beta fold hydrolase [Pseudonocardia oceani]
MTGRPRLAAGTVEVGALRLHVRTGRPGGACATPALLVPGLGSSSRYLEPLGAELASDRLVVAPDLPGTGRSPRAAGPLSLDELAGTLRRLMERMTGPATVVANSFGCIVAIELALRAPDLVERLVLTSPVLAPRARSPVPLVLRFARAMRHEPPRYLAMVLVDVLRASVPKGWADLRVLLEVPVLERAADLTVPTLVVRGTRDHLVPPPFARRVAARIPRGEFAELDSSHALPFAAPRALADLVRSAGATPGTPR